MSVKSRNCVRCVAALSLGLALALPVYGQSCALAAAPPLAAGTYLPTYVRLGFASVKVLDKDGHAVVGLAYNDFEIFADGKPQRIFVFDRPGQSEETCIGILMDRSKRQGETLADSEIEPTERFLQSTVDKDHGAFVSAFNDKTIRLAAYSNDPVTLSGEVRHIESLRPSGGTALYNAIEQAAQSISSMWGRRILVVIAQTGDSESRTTAADAIEAALRANTAVYFIQLQSTTPNPDMQDATEFAKEITSSTGGELLPVRREADFDDAFEEIKKTLSSLYLVGYTPSRSLTVGVHKLEVRTKRRRLYVIAPTRLYVSSTGPTTSREK